MDTGGREMDFKEFSDDNGFIKNPFSAKVDGEWKTGHIRASILNKHFGNLKTSEEMARSTNSEGLKLFFNHLNKEGLID